MATNDLDFEAQSLLPPTEFSRRGYLAALKTASYGETAAKDGWQSLRTWFQQNGAA